MWVSLSRGPPWVPPQYWGRDTSNLDMQVYEQLPPRVRAAVRQAVATTQDVALFAQWCLTMGLQEVEVVEKVQQSMVLAHRHHEAASWGTNAPRT